MPESVFEMDGEGRFLPTEYARGPWDPGALHGGAPAALITDAFERMQPGGELPLARLSFSFLRPIPMAALELSTSVTRQGRRVQELAAELRHDGVSVCSARALRILPVPEDLGNLATQTLEPQDAVRLAGPQEGQPVRFSLDQTGGASFASDAIEMRFLSGSPLIGGLRGEDPGATHTPSGRASVWMRLRYPLLPGESPSPVARVAAAADFSNGVAAALPFEDFLFINADLDISLNRRPQGEWVALDARTLLHPGGIGWARSVLHDRQGVLGLATQTLVVQSR